MHLLAEAAGQTQIEWVDESTNPLVLVTITRIVERSTIQTTSAVNKNLDSSGWNEFCSVSKNIGHAWAPNLRSARPLQMMHAAGEGALRSCSPSK